MHPLTRAAYLIAGRAATLAAAVVPEGEHKVLRSLGARRHLVEKWEAWARDHRDVTRPLVWMHAPSVGEGLQARPVLELLRAHHPDWQLAYSFFSPSAEAFASRLPVDVAGYLPFDTPEGGRRLMTALRPAALVFAKLDVWPVLCDEAVQAGVPLGMVSGTVSPTAKRSGGMASALLHDAYAAFSAVGAISPEDAQRLVALGCTPGAVRVTGDTRYDQVIAKAAGVDRTQGFVATLASERPTVVAGSTWPADEAVLLPAWEAVRQRVPGARLVIAPHEPTEAHLAPIERWAADTGIALARLGDDRAPEAEVVLVDRVGVLGDLYALGTCAWVGGGFHAAGLHSVLEPAAFGTPVVFGPRHGNSRDASLLLDADGGAVVRNAAEAADLLARWLGPLASAAGTNAREVVDTGRGAAVKALALVEGLVRRDGA